MDGTQQTIIQTEWKSLGSEKEILAERIKNNRDYLINIRFSKKRRYFGRKLQSSKVDTMDTFRFFPSFKDPRFVEMRKERDAGVQNSVEVTQSAVQTPWYRRVNAATQVSISDSLTDEQRDITIDPNDVSILQFLAKVEPTVTESLLQNTTVQIFKDDFADLYLDDAFVDRKLESQLKERAGLSNTEYSQKKKITSIHWQQKAKGVIAFGSVDGRPFDKRVTTEGIVQTSYVIVWNFNDPIWPQLVLEAPYDVQCIEFNPSDPRIVVGGLVNGQVVLWDLSQAEIPEQPVIDMLGEEKKPPHIKSLRWKQLSLVETSHECPVHAIQWIPNRVITDSGELVHSPATTQFLTVAPDGRLMIWDKDEDFVLPSKKAVKMKSEKLRGKWIPVNIWNVWTLDASRYLSCCSMFVIDYRIYFGTQDGEFVIASFAPVEKKSSMLDTDDSTGTYKTFNTGNITKTVYKAHFSICHTISKHPNFEDIFVSIGEDSFKLWKLDCPKPIWTSPFRKVQLTSGTWSPTRPGVLFIGRQDGVIEAWDLLDKSHAPSVESVVHQNVELTCMEFLKTSIKYSQYVAIGTGQGFVSVLEVPRNLARYSPDELKIITNFFKREEAKVEYYNKRFEIHKQHAEEMKRERSVKAHSEIDGSHSGENDGDLSQERKLELERMFREMTMKDSASLLNDE